MKLSLGNLNPNPCLPYFTNTYTCRVIITPKVCGDLIFFQMKYKERKKKEIKNRDVENSKSISIGKC